jgi:hypothetical protein
MLDFEKQIIKQVNHQPNSSQSQGPKKPGQIFRHFSFLLPVS